MLMDLLPTRDQWLPYLVASDDQELLASLESALQRLIEEALREVGDCMPPDFLDALDPLLRHVAVAASDPETLARFSVWRLPDTVLDVSVASLEAWRAVPELLLTRTTVSWKKRLLKADGFGPEHGAIRKQFVSLVAAHEDNEALRSAIASIRNLPPSTYGALEWRLIAALRRTLRHLAAELKIIFAEKRSADFVEVALSAQQALGRVDEPSELLLALDKRIQHLLVDEFQDTSHTQLRLLRLLTAGWEAADGRTLFLVGDPMQSIYRFRHADMSLFLKTKAQGIGHVNLASLVLENNFRSAPTVVDWVNRTFSSIFPAEDDMGAGAARFHACRATRPRQSTEAVRWHAIRSGSVSVEIERVTELLHEELQANPKSSIAVLVRSRSHLIGLQEQLRVRGLAAHAVELEAPNQRQVIQDLIGLTRALTHLGDRLAWLAILRAPWCGLRWRDLLELSAAGADRTIWTLVQDDSVLERLTQDGRARLLRTRAALSNAFKRRALQPFELWVEQSWVDLGGAECLGRPEEAAGVERYFAQLGALASHGDLDDPAALEAAFAEPYGQGEPPRESGIEIMTIHRAKGLEFDTVILLGLARKPRPESGKGLYWLERTAADGSEDLLLGPLATVTDGASLLTDFIKRADAVRDRAESMRMLYVATTRARDRLHLVAQLNDRVPHPPKGSLLEFLWKEAGEKFEQLASQAEAPDAEPAFIVPSLTRLRDLPSPVSLPEQLEPVPPRPEFLWASHAAVQVGTIVHAALHEISLGGLAGWSQQTVRKRRARFRRELALLGVDTAELEQSVRRIHDALCSILEDPRGRWLLEQHAQAASEFPMTVQVGNRLEHLRIDRTFVDADGVRWIVDFKTSVHEGGDVEAFLDSEVERYRGQLMRYADAIAGLEERPIRLGLYFPLLQAFRDWPAVAGSPVPSPPPGTR
jgi:ATP-dependent exoDNAse (exonuclease V) beta subunit